MTKIRPPRVTSWINVHGHKCSVSTPYALGQERHDRLVAAAKSPSSGPNEHTPGPWIAEPEGASWRVVGFGGYVVARNLKKGDAVRIASTTDLLNASESQSETTNQEPPLKSDSPTSR